MSKKTQVISISTKTGDRGESGLANGKRLPKDNEVFAVIGDIDELNSWLGLLVVKLGDEFKTHKEYLLEIQDTLFYVGAELAQSPKTKLSAEALTTLEKKAEALQLLLKDDWHTKFVLPGGTELGAYLDITRSVCRRAERTIVGYTKDVEVSPLIRQYINRLSDYLYLLRCFVNHAVEYNERQFEVK